MLLPLLEYDEDLFLFVLSPPLIYLKLLNKFLDFVLYYVFILKVLNFDFSLLFGVYPSNFNSNTF